MDQSTERLLKTPNCSFGINSDSSDTVCSISPEPPPPPVNFETMPTFVLGTYRTRHLSCILENWSESESYNSLPTEINQKPDDAFEGIADHQKPVPWEAEDVNEYITTLDESCILDIESLEHIDEISLKETKKSYNRSLNSSMEYLNLNKNRSNNNSTTGSTITLAASNAIENMSCEPNFKAGRPIEKYPNIMTASCYGSLVSPFGDKRMNASTDELLQKSVENIFDINTVLVSNEAKCRSPLSVSLSNSYCEGLTSMNNSFYEPKSMQSSVEFGMGGSTSMASSGTLQNSKTKINPLETSTISNDGNKTQMEEPSVREMIDNGKCLF